MVLATNSSARSPRLRGFIVGAVSLYVAIEGVSLFIVRVAAGGAWAAWIAFFAASTAIAGITVLLYAPRLRRVDDLTGGARRLSAGDFGARVEVSDDEFAGLASALNTAADSFGRIVGALTQERAQLEALLNASSDATVAVDTDGDVVYLNDAARHLFPAVGEGAMGRPFIEAVRDHDLNELVIAAARSGERSVRVVAYGQAQRWLQATAVPIEGAGRWAALAVFHDLTEVRRMEGMRRDFISNVSHELRTPLAGIRAAAETLQEGALDEPEAAQEFLGHIQRETDRMTQLVEELLELSRIESGAAPMHFAQIDASALITDTVRRFGQQAERAGLTLSAEVPAGPLPIIGDAERLERALGNLVANALKFTAPGGSVTLSAEATDGNVAISVSDTGIGIDAEQQGRVFERFYKADRGRGGAGIGLGLAIVKHIALAHEGTVSVESRAGRGSTFTMRLPRR
ncbi:MAG TPA: ATP-binding protein [Dehalococcoidia bacterium]|nr:ATP-binding protein [Dehalococcoidia bacterium]